MLYFKRNCRQRHYRSHMRMNHDPKTQEEKLVYRPLAGYGLPPPPLRGNFVDHIFLKAQCLARILQHVSPLAMAALSCNSLLHTLPFIFFILNVLFKISENAKDQVKFPNWLYLLSKLLLGHRYRPLKNKYSHLRCSVCYIFFIEPLLNDK